MKKGLIFLALGAVALAIIITLLYKDNKPEYTGAYKRQSNANSTNK